MVASVDLAESFQRLVPAAVAGQRDAATELLSALVDRPRERQAAALAVLEAADSEALWSGLVGLFATRRWQGARLPLPLESERWRQRLWMRLHALLTLHHDPRSDAARDAALITALKHRQVAVRACAADLLGERHAVYVMAALVEALDDPKPLVRVHAARALGWLGSPQAVEPLVGCLSHRNDTLAEAATKALARIGPPSVPALIEACQSSDEWVRWHAARALGHVDDPRTVEPLVKLLSDDDPTVRWGAVYALQRHGTAALAPVLHALVNGPVSPALADSAGHLLRQVRELRLASLLRPLGEQLRGSIAAVRVPVIAEQILPELERQQRLPPLGEPES